ncbi:MULTISPECIES: ABC transporter permease subunit [Exiguobacterium]|uniref:ABC transporter permease subunit n=1 Tax=Exiguobacterium TaxID=33986 RepID=UPI001BE92146|nr:MULTISPECIES: ABC transporter permease [Exiguobacterium]MCT4783895.1 ABC transporter permease subunit [Exiguobacterium himgiriensis]
MRSLLANEFMKWRRTIKPLIALGMYTAIILLTYFFVRADGDAATFVNFAAMAAMTFLGIFTIVFTAEMIGNELKYDTLKHLLMSPYSRDRILLSKLLAALLIMLAQFVFILAVTYGLALTLDGNLTFEQFRNLLLSVSSGVFVIFLTLMFSVVFKSTGVVIGFTVLANFLSTMIGGLLITWKPAIAKWIVFLHTDLSVYYQSPGFMETMDVTIWFSALYVLIHIVAFYIITAFMFRSKTFAE